MKGFYGVSLLTTIWWAGGCARVIPPADVNHPTTIYLTDYGRHSSVVLPVGDGLGVEYTYGDWKFYALNQWKWYVGAKALFWSEGATLGRRVITLDPDETALRQSLGAKRIVPLVVEMESVRALSIEVDKRYAANLHTEVYNESQRTYFVRDESSYGLHNSCNHATARWLQQLGCEVKGWSIFSQFRVEKAHAPSFQPQPAFVE